VKGGVKRKYKIENGFQGIKKKLKKKGERETV